MSKLTELQEAYNKLQEEYRTLEAKLAVGKENYKQLWDQDQYHQQELTASRERLERVLDHDI